MQFDFAFFVYQREHSMCFLENAKSFQVRNGCVRPVFLDSERGFVSVDHQILLTKLTNSKFSEKAVNYLNSRMQCFIHWCQITIPYHTCSTRFHTRTNYFFTLHKLPSRSMQKHPYSNVCRWCNTIHSGKNTGSQLYSYICNGPGSWECHTVNAFKIQLKNWLKEPIGSEITIILILFVCLMNSIVFCKFIVYLTKICDFNFDNF